MTLTWVLVASVWLGCIFAPLCDGRRVKSDTFTVGKVRVNRPDSYPPSHLKISALDGIPLLSQESTPSHTGDLIRPYLEEYVVPDEVTDADEEPFDIFVVQQPNRTASSSGDTRRHPTRKDHKRRRGKSHSRTSKQRESQRATSTEGEVEWSQRNVNPLQDQPNLSVGRESLHTPASLGKDDVIRGSRHAFTTTKMELKKEWCQTQPMRQVVREPGCVKTTIVNKFCYGQCNSFYIPRLTRDGSEASAFESCAFCRPRRGDWIMVTMRCPGQRPRLRRKRIYVIKQCKCMAQEIQD